jgi:hypothetical protein
VGHARSLFVALAVAALPGAVAAADPIAAARAYVAIAGADWPRAALVDAVEALAAVQDPAERDPLILALALEVPRDAESAFARAVALRGTPYEDAVHRDTLRQAILARWFGLGAGAGGADALVVARALAFASGEPDAETLVPLVLEAAEGIARPDGSFGSRSRSGPQDRFSSRTVLPTRRRYVGPNLLTRMTGSRRCSD